MEQLAPPAATDPVGHAAFLHAHPRWIAQAFTDALGARAGELDALLASDDERPVVHLAARPNALTAAELAAEVDGTVGRYSPYAVYLAGGDPGRLAAIRDGAAQVQDEGSQLVARALTVAELDGQDNGRWLDLCAGPGGKTALLAAIGAASGARVTAIDPTPRRADLVEDNVRGLDVDVHRVDGRDSGLEPGFDRVLVDAPCTGLGALRRRPEARWRRQPGDVPGLAKLQREVARGGHLADPPGRRGALRDLFAAPGRDGRGGGRRRARAAGDPAGRAGRCLPRSRTSVTARTSSCGRTGTGPMRCSPPP